MNPDARKSCRCRWVRKPCGWSWETSWEPLMWWAPGKWELLRDEPRWTPNCNPRSWIKMSSFRTFDALDALDIFRQKLKTVLIDSGRPQTEQQRSTQYTNTNVSDHFLLDIEVLHAISLQGFHLPFIDSPGGPRYRHLAARGFTAVIRWNEVYTVYFNLFNRIACWTCSATIWTCFQYIAAVLLSQWSNQGDGVKEAVGFFQRFSKEPVRGLIAAGDFNVAAPCLNIFFIYHDHHTETER